MIETAVEIGIAFILGVSLGVLGMGAWCGTALQRVRGQRDYYHDQTERLAQDYATERRKRLEAEQAHTDLADKHNLALDKLEAIRSIPNNGKKPNGGLLKAQRIAGKV